MIPLKKNNKVVESAPDPTHTSDELAMEAAIAKIKRLMAELDRNEWSFVVSAEPVT